MLRNDERSEISAKDPFSTGAAFHQATEEQEPALRPLSIPLAEKILKIRKRKRGFELMANPNETAGVGLANPRRATMGIKVRWKEKDSGVWWVFINHKGKRSSRQVGTMPRK